MINQLIDIDILTPLAFLSSNKLLNRYKQTQFSTIKSIKEDVFLTQRELRYDLPDQIHENLIESFFKNDKLEFSEYIDQSIKQIKEKYFNKDECIKNNLYFNWNNVLTFLPPLLFSSYSFDRFIDYSSLPIPYDKELISLTKSKMIETHLHINGTSEAIYNWHYFLEHLDQAYLILKESFKENSILFKQNNIYSIKDFINILKKSKSIFDYILYRVDYNQNDYKKWERYLSTYIIFDKYLEKKINAIKIQKNFNNLSIIEKEIEFYTLIFKIVDKEKKNVYGRLLHYYILSQSLFNKLFIQQLNQYGFSQFQRITDSKLRDIYENQGFFERYNQLKGIDNSNLLKHIELRFAPKNTTYKTNKLYSKIIEDYYKYKEQEEEKKQNLKIPTISMTTHFIKYKEQKNPKYIYIRDYKTKIELNRKVVSIIGLLSLSKPKYLPQNHMSFKNFDLLNAIDAAGNELYARPEAFAKSFRYIREQAKKRFDKHINITFHAGEDFVHLISGIRYIYEAITFLDMKGKDRIGHATALGLNPKVWKKKLNNSIVIKQGEYLDNLFFIIQTIKDERKYFNQLKNLIKEFKTYSKKIYCKKYSLRSYKKFSEYKWLDKEEAFKQLTKNQLEIFNNYHSIQRYSNYNEFVTIDLNDISDTIIVFMQNKILALLKEKNIAIESMITSNTRISFYTNFDEHHIIDWLQNPNSPNIVLASDDPGIFNTNLYLEYFILYKLLEKTNLDRKSIIKNMLQNAEIYHFSNN
ncbi:amidohydrolase family protein [Aliarcobacter butzleri]|uniref:hypothetical protein n=1 Tax=Aliarcobacter butzleri TaxID=28197 RepID=UPI0021B4DE22|nr:hypothetical protein [Aliarcobacter butzleri]MCT7587996.1 hypothetical protein [Aliarcobacter butzleri]MDN5079969.1 hypothetical protein [Aliarcobacter butzleri]